MKTTKAKLGLLLTGITAVSIMYCPVVSAADKVVVIPLFSSKSSVNVIPTVTSAGQVWMDRNLGAERVAVSSSDSLAYGWLYQWGRPADGHESRTSPLTALNAFATGDVPGHGNFILVNSLPNDWRNPQNDNLWQGSAGTNNPCPSGFRLPTEAEWDIERASWGSDNAVGAFASPLKSLLRRVTVSAAMACSTAQAAAASTGLVP